MKILIYMYVCKCIYLFIFFLLYINISSMLKYTYTDAILSKINQSCYDFIITYTLHLRYTTSLRLQDLYQYIILVFLISVSNIWWYSWKQTNIVILKIFTNIFNFVYKCSCIYNCYSFCYNLFCENFCKRRRKWS